MRGYIPMRKDEGGRATMKGEGSWVGFEEEDEKEKGVRKKKERKERLPTRRRK